MSCSKPPKGRELAELRCTQLPGGLPFHQAEPWHCGSTFELREVRADMRSCLQHGDKSPSLQTDATVTYQLQSRGTMEGRATWDVLDKQRVRLIVGWGVCNAILGLSRSAWTLQTLPSSNKLQPCPLFLSGRRLSSKPQGHGAAFLYHAELEEAAGLTFQEIKAGGLSSPNSLHGPQPRTAG